MSSFIEFLQSQHIIQLGTAFVIGVQVNQIASDFVDNIISPVVEATLINTHGHKFKNYRINIFGAKIEIGNFILSLLKFFLLMFVLYYVISFIQSKMNNSSFH